MKKLFQPFHLVTFSPWPLLLSFSILMMMFSMINIFYYFEFKLMLFSLMCMLICMYQWWRDVVRESTYQGFHTDKVLLGIKFGMILFIISELFFFFSIFWGYFHMFLSPSIEIGCIWPPKNILGFNYLMIPLLNTIILLSSGVSVTLCHYSLIISNKKMSLVSMLITVMLGLIFTLFQYLEYKESTFSISDSVYGSLFFMSTGFHGLHVLIGSIFLLLNFFRIMLNNYSSIHHFGFEAAVWYWHFVDLVWLFLYLLIYYWSY
uniref:Cytochrome c oxidase subunit 3 n=1 Tax=Pseudoligosita yasumatsui TaxID=3067466 RepID=A0AA49QG23_9HYME|nr:cytochrome c oxidase subunit III [Pseudoligosita yasumatsui]WLF85670.1 cytochrome c oxidase subunit 3 [Pseudoligosita yasumatsui]